MGFKNQIPVATDFDLQQRITACAAATVLPDPVNWVAERMWQFSAQPGWGDTYAAALAAGAADPGMDESVITDEMIRAAVQALQGGVGNG